MEFGPGIKFVADEVEELVAREPTPAAHDLVLHHRDVGRRPTERRGPELQEEEGEVGERCP